MPPTCCLVIARSTGRAKAPCPARGKGSNVSRGATGPTGCRDIPLGVSEEYGECTADRFENLSLHLFGLIVAPLVSLRAKRSNLASPNFSGDLERSHYN